MNGTIIDELRITFDNIKGELFELKRQVEEVNQVLNDGRLIPADMAQHLQDLLERHSSQASHLVSLGAELSLNIEGSIESIEADIESITEREKASSIRDIVLDYFRLTADAENVRLALEESKCVLAEKCRASSGQDYGFISPYSVVVENVKSEEELSDEDYDTIQEHFGRDIVRASDKKQLMIDADADISKYLDDSCELLRLHNGEEGLVPEEELSNSVSANDTDVSGSGEQESSDVTDKTNAVAEAPEPTVDSDHNEKDDIISADKPSDDTAEDREDDRSEPLLGSDFQGYADDFAIKYMDVPAKDLGAKQFISMCKQKPEVLDALLVFSHQIFLEDDDLNVSPDKAISPSTALVTYLINHGYLTKTSLVRSGNDREFYMLTSKAWECYSKSDVVRYFKSLKSIHVLPEALRIRPCELTPVVSLRLELIHDYFCKKENMENYIVFPDHPGNFISANSIDDSERTIVVCAAVFEKTGVDNDIETLRYIINAEIERKSEIHIIVISKGDIAVLSNALDLDMDASRMVRYCVHGQPDEFYDGSGKIVSNSNNEGGDTTEDSSITDKTRENAERSKTEQPDTDKSNITPSDADNIIADRSNEDRKDEGKEADHHSNGVGLSGQAPARNLNDLVDEYLKKGQELIRMGRFPEALVMFRALAGHTTDAALYYKWLAYALDDPALTKKYKYSELQETFSNQYGDVKYDALALAAYLRMFFSEDAREEHYYIKNCISALSGNSILAEIPQLKDCLFKLSDMFAKVKKGFDPTVVNLLLNENGRQERINRYCLNASALINGKLEETGINNSRIKETRKVLFGTGSMLYKMLCSASSNRVDEANQVSRDLRRFLDCEYEPGDEYDSVQLSDNAVADYVDGIWDSLSSVAKRQRADSLIGVGRTGIINKVKEVICTCLTWASLCEATDATQISLTEAGELKEYYSEIKLKLAESYKAVDMLINNDSSADASIYALRTALEELQSRLSGNCDINRDRYYYVPFLKGTFVELGEDYLPYFDPSVEEIAPLNMCKRVYEQGQTEDVSWREVLRRIFEDRDCGLDFGHAELIRDYLSRVDTSFVWPTNYDIKQNIEKARTELDSRYREFLARLEMADNYGWVENSSVIDSITADIERRRQHCLDSSNYGFYFRTMGSYISSIEHDAEKYKGPRLERLQTLRFHAGVEHPIFSEIERLINEHMYSVAQDYMDQYEKNGLTDIPESSSLIDEHDALVKFIERYGDYLKDAKEANRGKLSDGYRKRHKNAENNLVRSGIQMLEAWPRSEGTGAATLDKIKSLLEGIGLPVSAVKPISDKRFKVTFKAQEITADYPHPIGAYGSEMFRDGLNVFLLFGNQEATTMNTAIRKLITSSVAGASVIIADTQMSLADKKKLAMTIKQTNQNLSPYLILDRVMALHLAEQPKSERWNVFLRCSLPFHYLNPFTENSTLEICPDMFIGRRNELEQVMSPAGANIIYGGRQLGKTALLHHARRLGDHRAEGQWAVFVDLKPENAESAATTIYQKLQDEGFLPEDNAAIDWNGLARAITKRIRDGKPEVSRFILLLDEADNFLLDSQRIDYLPVVRLKSIQTDTNNRFKFVLAGLHNVIKFYDSTADGNSAIAHLGALTVTPLPFKEASELLEKPLSYLGFRLNRKDVSLIAQILSSTNYYPGLIQFYASRLVRSVCQGNYGNPNDKPPYLLQENQILQLLKDPEFIENIKEKFMITLGIDQKEKGYYNTLAHILAYCYYDIPEDTSIGYTADQIFAMCKKLDIHSISSLKIAQLRTLLDELTSLNVLRKEEHEGENRYVFSRTSFRHMLGDEEQVENVLQEIMEKEFSNAN